SILMPKANADDAGGLHFLLEESAPRASSLLPRVLTAIAGSLIIHLFVFGTLLALPDVHRSADAPVIVADLRKSIRIVAPRLFELTQKDPNTGKVSHQLDVRSSVSTPRAQAPRFVPPTPKPGPPPDPIQGQLAEPPKIEIGAAAPLASVGVPELPQPTQKPKL